MFFRKIYPFLMRIVGAAGATLLIYVLAKLTNPKFIGEFQLILTLGLGISIIVRGGVDRAITNYVAQTENINIKNNYFLHSVKLITKKIIYISLIYFFVLLVIKFHKEVSIGFYWIWVYFIFTSYSMLISGFYKGNFNPNLSYAYEMGFISLLSTLIFIILYFLVESSYSIYIGFVLAYIIMFIIFIIKYKKKSNFKILRKNIEVTIYKEQSSDFMWMTLVTYLQQLIIVSILAKYLSLNDLALFKVAEKISSLVGFFQSVVSAKYSPYFSKYYKENNIKEVKKTIVKCLNISLVISIPIFIALLLGGEYILSIFGEGYSNAYTILLILSISQLVNIIFSVGSIFLNQTSYTKISKKIVIICSLIMMPITATITYTYGGLGASISILLYSLLINFTFCYYAYKELR